MKTSRLDNIAFLKTAMMAVIVLYHSMLFFGGKWFTIETPVYEANYLYAVAAWMNTFHIQAFTMASGFLFYYLRSSRGDTNHALAIKKRAKRLLIPYLFTSLLWAVPVDLLLCGASMNDVLYKYGLMANPAQLWYLVMLFGVFAFFEFFGKRIKVNIKNFIIVYILTTVASMVLSKYHVNVFQLTKIAQYILYFYFGGYIYINKDKIKGKQALIMAISGIILYLITTFVMSKSGMSIVRLSSAFLEPLVSILEVGTIYYICTKITQKHKIKNLFYRLYEDNSFGIYLFHQQIVYFAIVLLNGVVHPVVQVILSFFIVSAISIIMTVILKQSKPTKFMFGI